MMKIKRQKNFKNGSVYAIELSDGVLIEVTDTFLPYYTKDAIGRKQNILEDNYIGSRADRWMIGVSVMSGCPVGCKFCATGQIKKFRNLSDKEIIDQVLFIVEKNNLNPSNSKEFKINYTRMGEPFLNINSVKHAVEKLTKIYPNSHHYISTIGIKKSNFEWIKNNITLQLSLHSLEDHRRNTLIPYKHKMSIEELGSIRTKSNLKTTLNLTLVDEKDFNIDLLKKHFDKDSFFIKLSPINLNPISIANDLGKGIIKGTNLI